MFNYRTSAEKQQQRLYVANYLIAMAKSSKKVIKVCSAPADNFMFEELILDSCGNNIIVYAFEKDAKTYKLGKARFNELKEKYPNIVYKNANMLDYDMSFFDFIFMDIFGCICEENIKSLIGSIDCIQNKGTQVFATFQNTRTYIVDRNKFAINLPDNIKPDEKTAIWSDWKNITLPKYIEKYTGMTPFGLPYRYANKSINPKATSMIMFHFKKLYDKQFSL